MDNRYLDRPDVPYIDPASGLCDNCAHATVHAAHEALAAGPAAHPAAAVARALFGQRAYCARTHQDTAQPAHPVVLNPDAIGDPDQTPIVQLPAGTWEGTRDNSE